MKTETIVLMNHDKVNMQPISNLERGSFYIIRHTEIVGLGHSFTEQLVFIDYYGSAHALANPDYAEGKCWDKNSSVDVVRKLEKITFNF